MHPKFIIVVGASAGGLNVLTRLVGQFKKDIDAAICIVMHVSTVDVSQFLLRRLQQATTLTCKLAANDMSLEKGHIYIAPGGSHLLVKENKLVLGRGPEENRWRPSIDVLFRSAAVAYDSFCIGVVLTGLLNDGSAGMIAIKKAGGTCIVQDPAEAEYPDMPKAVLTVVEVDSSTRVDNMVPVIVQTMAQKTHDVKSVIPPELQAESQIAENVSTSIEGVSRLGEQTVFSCPDCGGGLWRIHEGALTRYRCHIGHAYSQDELIKLQSQQIERTLWIALRMMEERVQLLERLNESSQNKGFDTSAKVFGKKAADLQLHIQTLKGLLFSEERNAPSNITSEN
jgi:two-component system chemotaxis response regulator CheB